MKKEDFVKGRWYKNLGEDKKLIAKFSGFEFNMFLCDGYVNSQFKYYNYQKKYTLTSYFNEAELCPLSEIQKYLPDGHPDKFPPTNNTFDIGDYVDSIFSPVPRYEEIDGKMTARVDPITIIRGKIENFHGIIGEMFKIVGRTGWFYTKNFQLSKKEIQAYSLDEHPYRIHKFKVGDIVKSKGKIYAFNESKNHSYTRSTDLYVQRPIKRYSEYNITMCQLEGDHTLWYREDDFELVPTPTSNIFKVGDFVGSVTSPLPTYVEQDGKMDRELRNQIVKHCSVLEYHPTIAGMFKLNMNPSNPYWYHTRDFKLSEEEKEELPTKKKFKTGDKVTSNGNKINTYTERYGKLTNVYRNDMQKNTVEIEEETISEYYKDTNYVRFATAIGAYWFNDHELDFAKQKETLIKQAKERGFIPGAKFIDLVNGAEFTVAKSDKYDKFENFSNGDQLYIQVEKHPDYRNYSARIYKDGKWAEIVEKKSNKFSVNETNLRNVIGQLDAIAYETNLEKAKRLYPIGTKCFPLDNSGQASIVTDTPVDRGRDIIDVFCGEDKRGVPIRKTIFNGVMWANIIEGKVESNLEKAIRFYPIGTRFKSPAEKGVEHITTHLPIVNYGNDIIVSVESSIGIHYVRLFDKGEWAQIIPQKEDNKTNSAGFPTNEGLKEIGNQYWKESDKLSDHILRTKPVTPDEAYPGMFTSKNFNAEINKYGWMPEKNPGWKSRHPFTAGMDLDSDAEKMYPKSVKGEIRRINKIEKANRSYALDIERLKMENSAYNTELSLNIVKKVPKKVNIKF